MADAATCEHNVIDAKITKDLKLFVWCVSCPTNLSSLESRVGKNYQYDRAHGLWVHVPRKGSEAEALGISEDEADYYESEFLLADLGETLDESRARRVERSQAPTNPDE